MTATGLTTVIDSSHFPSLEHNYRYTTESTNYTSDVVD